VNTPQTGNVLRCLVRAMYLSASVVALST